jgi:hypothetical protein
MLGQSVPRSLKGGVAFMHADSMSIRQGRALHFVHIMHRNAAPWKYNIVDHHVMKITLCNHFDQATRKSVALIRPDQGMAH